jgi:XcyI restriction endonuclease
MAKKGAKPATSFHQQLLASDDFAQYSLRSTFFVRRLRAFNLWRVIDEVRRLNTVNGSFDWSALASLGIEADAWARLQVKQIPPALYFCHPRVLAEQPQLLLYYRTAALISQKGLDSLVTGSCERLESGKVMSLSGDAASRLAVALNSILSAMLKATADIERDQLSGLQFASLGATIQGSWNNAIGSEGEAAIKTILMNHLRDEILQIVWRDKSSRDYAASWHTELLDHIADVRIVRMKQGFHLVFSSEMCPCVISRTFPSWRLK